jgi:hypothetical protein
MLLITTRVGNSVTNLEQPFYYQESGRTTRRHAIMKGAGRNICHETLLE